MDMDVMLSLVNGVNGHKHKTEFDNGVLQVRHRDAGVKSGRCAVNGWCIWVRMFPKDTWALVAQLLLCR
jgi:hypothetical protein